MSQVYPAKAIANWFLAKDRVTPMKLQKLVYFAHGWNLAIRDEPLIDEEVEAWRWGPVVPTLYHEFKQFGSDRITRLATSWKKEGDKVFLVAPSVREDDEATNRLLAKIHDVYGQKPGVVLSALTHLPDSPWTKTWNERGRYFKGTDIPNEEIKAYFKRLANQQAHA